MSDKIAVNNSQRDYTQPSSDRALLRFFQADGKSERIFAMLRLLRRFRPVVFTNQQVRFRLVEFAPWQVDGSAWLA